jgi:hypothetical protein
MDINQHIIEGYKNKLPINEICLLVNRSKSSVLERAKKLGLTGEKSSDGKNGKIEEDSSFKGETTMSNDYDAVLANECREAGIAFDDVQYWWYKTQRASIFVKKNDFVSYDHIRDDMIAEMKKYSPKYKYAKLPTIKEPTLQILPRADDHFGKLTTIEETGMEYNLKVARQRADDGAAQMLALGQPFNVQNFAVIIGNDVMHIDVPKRQTTSGTPQDTDGSIFTMYDAAKASYIALIERLAVMGNVYLFFVPSNHDWVSSRFLADSIGSWFNKNPRVHLGGEQWWNLKTRHRKYMVFGENLIMFSHGDGAKEKDLHWHLATEAKEAWGNTSFRYVYLGHIHHKDRKANGFGAEKLEKDLIGFTEINSSKGKDPQRQVYIEYVRSQSATDSWHDRNGYTSLAATESFIHHPKQGQIARFTHYF